MASSQSELNGSIKFFIFRFSVVVLNSEFPVKWALVKRFRQYLCWHTWPLIEGFGDHIWLWFQQAALSTGKLNSKLGEVCRKKE